MTIEFDEIIPPIAVRELVAAVEQRGEAVLVSSTRVPRTELTDSELDALLLPLHPRKAVLAYRTTDAPLHEQGYAEVYPVVLDGYHCFLFIGSVVRNFQCLCFKDKDSAGLFANKFMKTTKYKWVRA